MNFVFHCTLIPCMIQNLLKFFYFINCLMAKLMRSLVVTTYGNPYPFQQMKKYVCYEA